ncbi:NusG domain II-containing protein, partial [Dysosmobacter welbionis]
SIRPSASPLRQHLLPVQLLQPSGRVCENGPVKAAVHEIVEILHLQKGGVLGVAAVDLIQVIQHAVLFAIEADELPEHGETGGLDEDLLDLPVGLQPAIRQEQHQNGPAQAAVDHHDVPHGLRLVVVLVVEHAHPPL